MKRYNAVVGAAVICFALATSAAFSGSKDKKNGAAAVSSVQEKRDTSRNPAVSGAPDSQKKKLICYGG